MSKSTRRLSDPTPWRLIVYWRLRDLYHDVRRIPRWLWKSVQYALFLWNDWDFDHSSILKLLGFKLARMRKRIERDNLVLATPRIVKQIRYAEFLIDRICKEDYFPEEYEAIVARYGEMHMQFEPTGDLYDGEPTYSVEFVRDRCFTEEDKINERALTFAHRDRANAELQKDYARLFRHMKRYIQHWWD